MGYMTQPNSPQSNLGGGAARGRGFQPSTPDVWMDAVGGIPSLQPAHYYNQWATHQASRYGELAYLPRPVQHGIVDITLGRRVGAPVIPRGIPGTWQLTVQKGFGTSTHEYIGLRAPRLNEGAGCNATGSMMGNSGGG